MLYDKDHYKLALGQINTARNLIDKLAKGAPPLQQQQQSPPTPQTPPCAPGRSTRRQIC